MRLRSTAEQHPEQHSGSAVQGWPRMHGGGGGDSGGGDGGGGGGRRAAAGARLLLQQDWKDQVVIVGRPAWLGRIEWGRRHRRRTPPTQQCFTLPWWR